MAEILPCIRFTVNPKLQYSYSKKNDTAAKMQYDADADAPSSFIFYLYIVSQLPAGVDCQGTNVDPTLS